MEARFGEGEVEEFRVAGDGGRGDGVEIGEGHGPGGELAGFDGLIEEFDEAEEFVRGEKCRC